MLLSYVKIAIKSLLRRKFFLAVSLFGIGFTLAALLVNVALLDHIHAPLAPEVNLDRTLHLTRVVFHGTSERGVRSAASNPGYALLDRHARDIPGVEKMSIFSESEKVAAFIEGEKAEFTLRRVDDVYWEILDFVFLEGSPLIREDEENAQFAAIISRATRQRFFGDDAALGRTVEVDGQRFRVVGVVENVASTRWAATGDIWVPLSTAKSQDYRERLLGGHGALLLAASATDFPRIKAEYESRLSHLEPDPPFDTVLGTALTRFDETIISIADTEDGKPQPAKYIFMVMGVVAAFLLLPIVNLVSINITRILERSGEIGVRKAFGASSLHLVGQFIAENVVLCLLGGAVGLAGAAVALELIETAGWFPYTDLGLNYRVFLYALALACGFGVLSGAFPAWRMSRLHPVAALRGGER